MRDGWKLKDFIDLEYIINRDINDETCHDRDKIIERDRKIYLNYIAPQIKIGRNLSKKQIIKSWLEQRKNDEKERLGPDTIFPGDLYSEVYRLFLFMSLILGGLIGSGLAFSLLSYTGAEPQNVAVYFGLVIVSQLIFIFVLISFSLWRIIRPGLPRNSVIHSIISGLIAKIALNVKKQLSRTIPGGHLLSMKAAIGIARGKNLIYGRLFYWPVFILLQVFGIFFNLGAFFATILKVIGSDVAFGWQSTVQFSPQLMHTLVKFIAFPWAWIVPAELAYPSLSQIEGSRIVLKNGIYHLATLDLVAWWPFLCFAVLSYGLLPRAVLFFTGVFAQNLSLRKQRLDHSECDRIMNRLESPLLTTMGRPDKKKTENHQDNRDVHTKEEAAHGRTISIPSKEIIALIPDDIFEEFTDAELYDIVERILGYRIMEKIRIGESFESEIDTADKLIRRGWNGKAHPVLLLQEAWQPPIQETLSFIKSMRKVLGGKANIIVGLIGKPSKDTIFTSVEENDWQAWNKNLHSIGDPYLRLERLVKDGL